MNTPVTPYAVGSAPEIHCHSGCLSPLTSGPFSECGTYGFMFATLTKKTPTAMTKTQTETLTMTRAFVTSLDSRMPIAAIVPMIATIATAPRLTTESSSPKYACGRPSACCR